ncbi:MAG: hypothetical protein ACHQ2E_11190 [Gemmatimonadales bacterium]
MPIEYRIDHDWGLVRTRCTGEVTLQEVIEHFDVLERDPDRPPRLHVLLQLTGMLTLPRSDELQAVAGRMNRLTTLRFGVCAILVDRDIVYGIARMFAAFAESRFESVQVFKSAEAAETWLAESIANDTGEGPQ